MPYTQEGRRMALKTPLGDDALMLTKFNGYEEMSRLFSYSLEMLSENDSIAPKDIIGKNVTVTIKLPDDSPRYFNGFVSRFSYCGTDDRLSRYTAEVVPWLWFLTMTADCRIFQSKTLPKIIEQIFGDLGFSDYELSLRGTHPEWEYCVQYRETDFNFVSRLMEQEGMFYFFRHEDGKHTMVLADNDGAYEDCVENSVNFGASLSAPELTDEITSWEHKYEFRPGKWAHTDYNFTTPSASLMAQTNTVIDLEKVDKYEIYDYPGEYANKGDGDSIVKVRMEEEETPHDVVVGSGKCRTFTPGGKFTIERHHSSGEEGKGYVITSVQHSVEETSAFVSGSSRGGDVTYGNTFSCIPDGKVFRPARTTPKPLVQGAQTAVVTGPAGEEIYPDEYGRVKVQFFWDREGKKDENTSCWIRVAQPWAGNNWGFITIPRIGQEVVVNFLDGDPDRPLITGSVYNAEQMPPYGLPDNKTQSGIKSRSSKEGSGDNFNEIRFEDKKGEEQLFIHAEKNQDIEVENDETHWVGNDQSITVDHDRSESIGNDRSLSVGHDKSEKVDNDKRVQVKNNQSITVGGNHDESIDKNMSLAVSQNRKMTVKKDVSNEIGESLSTNVGKDSALSVGKNHGLDVGKQLAVKAGDRISIESDKEILLKTGSASLLLKKNGDIILKGGKITVKGSKDLVMKGSKIAEN